jgi:predicted transcriptional regulator
VSVGEILLERGKIKPEHLQAALAARKSPSDRIDRILVRMGLVDKTTIMLG